MLLTMNQSNALTGESLTLERIAGLLAADGSASLTADAESRINRSREVVEQLQRSGGTFYGINTGFGGLANQRISMSDIDRLQENLILSHAVGVGDEVPPEIVRLMLVLKISSLAIGLSGVRVELVRALLALYNAHVTPIVYTQGSLGASGDLAPLAHLTLPLLGLGEVQWQGRRQPASAALKGIGL